MSVDRVAAEEGVRFLRKAEDAVEMARRQLMLSGYGNGTRAVEKIRVRIHTWIKNVEREVAKR